MALHFNFQKVSKFYNDLREKIANTKTMSSKNRIKELRKKARIPQDILGAEIGCNKSKISKLENGKQELTQNWMIKIASALTKFGLPTKPSDLLPTDHVYHSDKEYDFIKTIRALEEPQRQQFEAMMDQFKISD